MDINAEVSIVDNNNSSTIGGQRLSKYLWTNRVLRTKLNEPKISLPMPGPLSTPRHAVAWMQQGKKIDARMETRASS